MKCNACGFIGDGFKVRGISKSNGKLETQCPSCGKRSRNHIIDYQDAAVVESAKVRKYQDIANFAKRQATAIIRDNNAILELYTKLIESVSQYKFDTTEKDVDILVDNSGIGIINLTDLHFNELIDLKHNKFDFSIASSRLHKLACKAINLFGNSVAKVKVLFSGDVINSNRRTDELMSAATNRANALVMASDILANFINHIAVFYDVDVHYVVGNESRIEKDLSFSKTAATDNFDYLVIKLIESRFHTSKGVTFIQPDDPNETVVQCGAKNILLLHGYNLKAGERSIQEMIGKYAKRGTIIDYVIFGHMHSPYVSSFFARGGSLCGDNAYSDMFLGLGSKASQNVFCVTNDSIDAYVIDLQNSDGYVGYDFHLLEDAYNPKSITKAKKALNA